MGTLVAVARFVAPFIILLSAGYYIGALPFQQPEPDNAELAEAQAELEAAEAALQKAKQKFSALAENTERTTDERAVLVETSVTETWTKPFTIETEGEAVRYRILTVPAEVAGRIRTKTEFSRGGNFVKAGTPLFEIDPTDYQLEVDRLTAQLRQSAADLQSVDVDEDNTKQLLALAAEDLALQTRQLRRFQSGFDRSAITENDLEQIQRQELTARNSQQTLKNQMRSLAQKRKTVQAGLDLVQAQLNRAKKDLERTKISAPITSSVIDDIVEEGNYVKPGDPLVHLSDTSRMEVKCTLEAEELAWIWLAGDPGTSSSTSKDVDPLTSRFEIPEMPCDIIYELQGAQAIWKAKLSRYEGVGVDQDTRTIACRALVPNPREVQIKTYGNLPTGVTPPSLMSGLFVTVRIPVTSPVAVLSIPATAVRPGGQVWVNRDGKLDVLDVSISRVEGDKALILRSNTKLREGDRVIVSPLPAVRSGMKLTEQSPREAGQ